MKRHELEVGPSIPARHRRVPEAHETDVDAWVDGIMFRNQGLPQRRQFPELDGVPS